MNKIQTYKKPLYVRIPVGIVKIIGLVLWFFIKPIFKLFQNIIEWIISKVKLLINTIIDTLIKYVIKYAIIGLLIFLTFCFIRNEFSISKTFSLDTWYYAISIFK